MNRPWLGWSLAATAFGVGYWSYGWPGVALAATATVFWLLLLFSRAMRAMRLAAGAPVGTVASAVMLHAQLRPGMTMLEVLPLAGSIGSVISETSAESYRWRDGGGSAVVAVFANGRLLAWQLERTATEESATN